MQDVCRLDDKQTLKPAAVGNAWDKGSPGGYTGAMCAVFDILAIHYF